MARRPGASRGTTAGDPGSWPSPAPLPAVALADAALRRPVAFEGVVEGLEVVPRAGTPWLEVRVGDGSGEVVVVFTGCRHVAGVASGRRLRIEGVLRRERQRLVCMNPAYLLLGSTAEG